MNGGAGGGDYGGGPKGLTAAEPVGLRAEIYLGITAEVKRHLGSRSFIADNSYSAFFRFILF